MSGNFLKTFAHGKSIPYVLLPIELKDWILRCSDLSRAESGSVASDDSRFVTDLSVAAETANLSSEILLQALKVNQFRTIE